VKDTLKKKYKGTPNKTDKVAQEPNQTLSTTKFDENIHHNNK